jgi:hypothetical protein
LDKVPSGKDGTQQGDFHIYRDSVGSLQANLIFGGLFVAGEIIGNGVELTSIDAEFEIWLLGKGYQIVKGVQGGKLITTNGKKSIAKKLLIELERNFKTAKDAGGEIHHMVSNKGAWAKKFAKLFEGSGIGLDDACNKMWLPGHAGRHIEEYHQMVERMLKAAIGPKTGEEKKTAILGVLKKLRELLEEDPRLPYSDGGLR